MSPAQAPTVLPATSLPAPLAGLRTATARGAVLAAFERSLYLDLEGRIVALASTGLDRGVLTIGIQTYAALRSLGPGDGVALEDGALQAGALTVDLRTAAVWNPALPQAANPARAGRETVISELLTCAPAGSLAPLLAQMRPGRRETAGVPDGHVEALVGGLAYGLSVVGAFLDGRTTPDGATDAVGRHIAGRGVGLTPSGDDLLVGIMLALTAWPQLAGRRDAAAVCELLAAAARARTTRISAAYLDAACRGWAAEPWHALVRSLAGSPTVTRAAVRRLLRVGETSGADALTGFCWLWQRVPAAHAEMQEG